MDAIDEYRIFQRIRNILHTEYWPACLKVTNDQFATYMNARAIQKAGFYVTKVVNIMNLRLSLNDYFLYHYDTDILCRCNDDNNTFSKANCLSLLLLTRLLYTYRLLSLFNNLPMKLNILSQHKENSLYSLLHIVV